MTAFLLVAQLVLVAAPEASGANVADALHAALKSGGVPADLVVVYDDRHGLHGGIRIEIHGDGQASRSEIVPPIGRLEEIKVRISREQLLELEKLLVDLEAWEQRTPERDPVPDESRARLEIHVAGGQAGIWEWYNDMPANGRLLRIKRLVESLVPPKKQ